MFLFGHANESVVDNSRLGIVYHKNTHAHTYTQLLLFHEIQGMTLFKEKVISNYYVIQFTESITIRNGSVTNDVQLINIFNDLIFCWKKYANYY